MGIFRSSLSRRIVITFLFIALLLIALISVSHAIMISTLSEQTKNYYANTVAILARQIGDKLTRLEQMVVLIGNDSNMIYSNYSDDSPASLRQYLDAMDRTKYYSANSDILNTISVFLPYKDRVLASDNRFGEINQYNDPTLHAEVYNLWFVRTIHALHGRCPGCDDPSHYSEHLSYIYRNPSSGEKGVIVSVDIAMSEIRRFISDVHITGQGALFLLFQGDESITSDPSVTIDAQALRAHITGDSPAAWLSIETGAARASVRYQIQNSMIVGAQFLESEMTAPIHTVWVLLIICVAVTMMLATVFIVMSYRDVLQPFNVLVEAMRKVRDGNLKVRIEQTPKYEMGFVYEQFNQMTERIDYLINQVYAQDVRSRKAQLKHLQSQIHPHFLFNCLNFIYQMSMAGKSETSSAMTLYLSQYYRYSFSQSGDVIPLEREIENIRVYMEICAAQYPQRVSYQITVPEAIGALPVPKLAIQTVVENAFEHGLKQVKHQGIITIQAREDRQAVVICVGNNNSELTPDDISLLNAQIHETAAEQDGYGLRNTYMRLILQYGETADLYFSREVNTDITMVTLIIPKGGTGDVLDTAGG